MISSAEEFVVVPVLIAVTSTKASFSYLAYPLTTLSCFVNLSNLFVKAISIPEADSSIFTFIFLNLFDVLIHQQITPITIITTTIATTIPIINPTFIFYIPF